MKWGHNEKESCTGLRGTLLEICGQAHRNEGRCLVMSHALHHDLFSDRINSGVRLNTPEAQICERCSPVICT